MPDPDKHPLDWLADLVDPDGTWGSRESLRAPAEELKKVAVHADLDPVAAADPRVWDAVVAELRARLARMLAKTGRVQVRDITVEREVLVMTDQVRAVLWVWTREDQTGQWPSIRAALREDGLL